MQKGFLPRIGERSYGLEAPIRRLIGVQRRISKAFELMQMGLWSGVGCSGYVGETGAWARFATQNRINRGHR